MQLPLLAKGEEVFLLTLDLPGLDFYLHLHATRPMTGRIIRTRKASGWDCGWAVEHRRHIPKGTITQNKAAVV